MDWYWLPPVCGMLSVAVVPWFLAVCAGALDAEHERVSRGR